MVRKSTSRSPGIFRRQPNGFMADQGGHSALDVGKAAPSGIFGKSSWAISSIFGGDSRLSMKESTESRRHSETIHNKQQSSTILLREANHTKQNMHNVFIRKLYRESLFEEMLQKPREIARKRRHCQEMRQIYQQAFNELNGLPLEAESVEMGYNLCETNSRISTLSDSLSSPRRSSYSGKLQPPLHINLDANGIAMLGF